MDIAPERLYNSPNQRKGEIWEMTSQKREVEHPRLRTAGEKLEMPAHERVTPENIARRRFRQDKPFYSRFIYFNRQATKDSIRHFAEGIGDMNPLYRDEDYARKTKYGNIIAPPCYLYPIQWGVPGGGLTGIHGWYVGGDWEFYRPIYAGDEFRVVGVLRELVEKQGRMGGGKTWISYDEVIYINQRGEIVGKERGHVVMAERAAAGSAGKYRDTPKPVYSREDWAKILKMYDEEEVRGAEPRYWEDVKVGDQVGPMIKGPLTVRDMLGWLMGAGSPFFKAHKNEYEYERRHPQALEYVQELGEADVPELVHIFDAYARTIGVERAYDYGCQRMAWLGNLFTNWMGDDGFLWKLSGDERVFNQIGDLTTFEGKVVKKYIDAGRCCVDVENWATNQRGEPSITHNISTVVLPSREHGPAVYPNPTPKLTDEVAKARPLDELIKEGLI